MSHKAFCSSCAASFTLSNCSNSWNVSLNYSNPLQGNISLNYYQWLSSLRKGNNRNGKTLNVFITGLRNKPQGCGASVASAAAQFTKKIQQTDKTNIIGVFLICSLQQTTKKCCTQLWKRGSTLFLPYFLLDHPIAWTHILH
jgi:hypothetical protein